MGQGQAKTGPSFACTPTPPPPDLNKACGNAMDAHEAAQMHQNFSQQLLQDHIEACSLPEHNLITWTDGPPPVQFQAQNGPNTSLASLL